VQTEINVYVKLRLFLRILNQLIGSENENMKLKSDQEIENLSLQINTGNVAINQIYVTDVEVCQNAGKTLSILYSRLNYYN